MTFEGLLSELAKRSVQLRRDGENLRYRGDKDELNSVLLNELRRQKPSVLKWLGEDTGRWVTPRAAITPEMLSLVDLTQADIERIIHAVPEGAANIADIYPLSPLQEGLLFHHLLTKEGDAYLEPTMLAFDSRQRLDGFIEALQKVIDRHDVLRSAVLWEELPEPLQVVWRKAPLTVEEVMLEGNDIANEFYSHFDPRHNRIDVRTAPLLRVFFAEDQARGRWLLGLLRHHLITDHTSLELMIAEVRAHLAGEQDQLPEPVPYKNFVAQARFGVSREEHETFFSRMLGTVDEPTAPLGLMDVQQDGSGIAEASLALDSGLCLRLRERARKMGVSVASLCHLAWARVLSLLTGRIDVVFGTVLFGRMQGVEGIDRAMGMFINTLPLRIVAGDESVEQAVHTTHTLLSRLLHHEHAPLALAQRCSKVPPPAPLFTTLLNYRYSRDGGGPQAGETILEGMQVLYCEERINYPVGLSVDDFGKDLELTAQVPSPIDPLRICRYMNTALAHLTDALERTPQAAVRSIEVMNAAERRQVLYDWNVTGTSYPKDTCIHQLFEAQVHRTPDAVAVVYEDQSLTYNELNKQANRLAHHLVALGVVPDTTVAIGVTRSLEMVVGLLAVLKAGGAYVPLDPAYPAERLGFMLEDSAPRVLLTQTALKERWSNLSGQVAVVEIDAETSSWEQLAASNLEPRELGLTARHLAYVIYTSGSTGKPKGVMAEHRGLVNLAAAQMRDFEVTADSRILQFVSFSFDMFISEVAMTLCSGAVLHLHSGHVQFNSEALLERVTRQQITHISIPPSVLATWPESANLESVRCMIVAGDQLPGALVKRWANGRLFFNAYGPTENTVCATAHRCNAHHDGNPPIGGPIANTRMYVLDQHRQPVPVGVAGELFIGGIQVARGYLHRPELTAERFLPDPFAKATEHEPAPRMYRTGDLGRWRPDGHIEFLGRNDFQVKIRGYRIELGEIEARLCETEGVKEAVVLAAQDATGDKRLVAYYTGSEELGAETLRSRLSGALPGYMVPAAYVHLEALPLTANGKLDRKALPAPEGDAFGARAYEAPQGEAEQTLAAIWTELLQVEKIGRRDHFFELGGHSLLAVTLISRMRGHGLHADMRTLFTTPVLCEFAAAIRAEPQQAPRQVPPNLIPADCQHITPDMLPLVDLTREDIERIAHAVPGGAANIADIYPLSPLQEGLLFHHLMTEKGDAYLLPIVLAFDIRKRLEGFIDALQKVIDRHDILRTAILWEELPEPVQVVWRDAPLPVEEVMISKDKAIDALDSRIDPRHHRIDVSTAPMMRTFVAEDKAQGRWLLGLLSHHLAADHTSLELIVEEVRAHLAMEQDRLPEPISYRNFVARARLGVSRAEHEKFFSQMLGTVDEPTAPLGLMDVRQDGSGIAEVKMPLDSALCLGLRERARKMGVSVASLCHLAWARVLSRLTGRIDVVFGTVLFGRMQSVEGIDRAMGMFINTLPLRIVAGDESVEQAVHTTHTLLSRLLHHEHAPLSLAQRCSNVSPPAPLFTALLNYRYSRDDGGSQAGETTWEGIQMLYSQERSNYPVLLNIDDFGQDLGLNAQVAEPIDPMRICGYMRTALENLNAALEKTPQAHVRSIEIMDAAELRQVLFDWNATKAALPRDNCLHQLFEEQVAKTPDAVAVVYEEKRLTYQALNQQANRLAHYLIGLGVAPDTIVAICVERGLEMVVGLLAVLKAGGAYVPLDPTYPVERLAYMIEDSAPALLLTHSRLKDRRGMPAGQMPVIELDRDTGLWQTCSSADPDPRALGLKSHHLAYVIYTSGSTGKPKGVMVEHRNVINFLIGMRLKPGLASHDTLLAVTTLSFDIHVLELYLPLIVGAECIIVTRDVAANGEQLLELMNSSKATAMQATPTTWRMLISSGWKGTKNLKALCGGEAFPIDLAAKLKKRVHDLWNMFGPTETTVWSTVFKINDVQKSIPIGKPIVNTQIYVLDQHLQPVPVSVPGELYIGGAGVARGYLNRPELTAKQFLPDPFAKATGHAPAPRMYRTGDLGRFLPDGHIEFMGRNDMQVKIRGFRIEPGEIEARLIETEGVKEAVVLAAQDPGFGTRLIAYYTGSNELGAETLRRRLSSALPGYMVPAAYVHLEALPLTANGKLDRKALPAPEGDAFGARAYEAPQGEAEQTLAAIWAELLQVEKIGRRDHFFELGGHSLSAVTLIARMHKEGLHSDVRTLFAAPILADLAAAVSTGPRKAPRQVPPNLIPADCQHITPDMLPLVDLTQKDIERIAHAVPGGAANIADIYPLSPLQEGILFHHLMTPEGDAYLMCSVLAFDTRKRLNGFVDALQMVIDRHDILRTAVLWEQLPEPVQVVWRNAPLPVEEVIPNGDNTADRLYRYINPRSHRLDISQAPLMRATIAEDRKEGRWILGLLNHHLIDDNTTLQFIVEEVRAHLSGEQNHLPEPISYRNFVARARLGVSRAEHEKFFSQMLGTVDEPTAPFGLMDVRQDGSGTVEASMALDSGLCLRLRERARQMGVSLASLCHLAWARVLSLLSGRIDVVFGTVLFGRMQGVEGIERAMGMFINTLPLRIVAGDESVEQAVYTTHTLLSRLLHHEHAPLALAQRCSAVSPPAPLFTTILNYRRIRDDDGPRDGETAWEGMQVLRAEERTNYPFALSVDDFGKGLGLTAHVQSPVDPMRICEYMRSALAHLSDLLMQAPQTPVRSIEVMSAAERRQVLFDWNRTDAAYPKDRCIHALFEARVEKTPDAVAVVCEGEQLTYARLNSEANRLAHHLIALGVGPDTPVAVCVTRSLGMVVGLLAVLKAGGAYVPLDPAYPAERLGFMLEDSAPRVLLTQSALKARWSNLSGQVSVVEIDAETRSWEQLSASNPEPRELGLTARHLAYVIYTSGSTGRPKGVMVEHHNLCNLVHWHCNTFSLKKNDSSSCLAGLGFDASTWEIWPPLCVGAVLVLAPAAVAHDPAALLAWWRDQALDVSFLPTPIAEHAFTAGIGNAGLRYLLTGGDRLHRLPVPSSFHLMNNYGPTEATVVATSGELEPSQPVLHIGRPIANARIYILDGNHQPVPVGVTGEIVIGGAGVGRGYLNRPELTAERFLPDPFVKATGHEPDPRMYRTGDLGRFLPNGNIEFLGRNDFQVKIRGYRIELGEIEARLCETEGVKEAVVLAAQDATGDKRLVAYYTGSDELGAETLRNHLSGALPGYMVPAAYVHLTALPLTVNGKLDRKALPAPEGDAFDARAYEAPVGKVEQTLAAIWAELLHIEKIGRRDHFFELGGHSLLAVRLIAHLRMQLGVELPLAELFAHPGLSELAIRVQNAGKSTLPAITTADRSGALPLSYAQQRLWFLDQLEENAGRAYHIGGGVKLTGVLDAAILKAALNRIVRRHEVLRTTFTQKDGVPLQLIASQETGFLLLEHDLTATPGSELERLVAEEAATAFDLAAGPLIRGRLIRLSGTEHILLVTMHHIVSDGWSLGVFINELSAIYQAFLKGQDDPLPPLAIQYVDYAVWQRRWMEGDLLQQQLTYWTDQLEAAPALFDLPTDHPRPAVQDYAGAATGFVLDAELTKDLKDLSQRHGVTLFMTLLAGWAALLSRLSGQSDIVIGTPAANRTRTEIEPLIGFFINTLALRIDLTGRPTVAELLTKVKQLTLEAQSHQDIPFEQVVEAVNPVRSLSYSPLVQMMVVWQNTPEGRFETGELQLQGIQTPRTTTQFDLSLYMQEAGDEIAGELEYATALFEQSTIACYPACYRNLLRAMAAGQDQSVEQLPIGDEAIAVPVIAAAGQRQPAMPLSFHQQRLWFIDRFEAGSLYASSPTYHNIPLLLQIDGHIKDRTLEEALNLVAARHPVLRCRMGSGADPRQRVDDTARIALDVVAYSGDDIVGCALARTAEPFLLNEQLLVRATLFRQEADKSLLAIAAHHIIADRRSMDLLAAELIEICRADADQRPVELPRIELDYFDYLYWQRAMEPDCLHKLQFYWKHQLRGRLQPVELPLKCVRPAIHTFTAARYTFAIAPELAGRLRALAAREGVSDFDVLFGGFAALIRRYTGHEEIVIGTSAACRSQTAVRNVIGPIANLLVLRAVATRQTRFADLLAQVGRTRRQALVHREMPFDRLVAELNPEKDMSRTALFDLLFQYEKDKRPQLSRDDLQIKVIDTNLGYGKYDLHLLVRAGDGRLAGDLVYNANFFDPWFIRQMMGHYIAVLEAMAADATLAIDNVALLDAAQEQYQLTELNDTAARYPHDKTIHQLIEAQAARTPDHAAVSYQDNVLSYRQLNQRANRLAHYLRKCGVGPEVPVALCLERSVEMIVAILGVMKAGGAYVPVDPAYPQDRIDYMLADSGCALALSDSAACGVLASAKIETVLLDAHWDRIAPEPCANPANRTTPDNLIYVIYTSGSTGRPKATLLEHRNVVRLLVNDRMPFRFGPQDVWSMFHACTFDFSVWEIYGALLYGGRVAIVPEQTRKDPALFARFVEQEQVTVLSQTPSAFYGLSNAALALPRRSLAALRYVVFGGEKLNAGKLAAFHAAFADVALINMYGITETCVHVTFNRITDEQIRAGLCHIGRPIPTTTVYIMDESQRLVPLGVAGELCVGGPGVGRGYLNQDQLTAQRFIANPYVPGERIYRSGDVARRLENGEMLYLGRMDHQVQLRGFRIEPGEIEARLAEMDGVTQAAVLARQDTPFDTRLVAYYTGSGELGADSLRTYLAGRLPEYMVPAAYVHLNAMPLTVNGKLDRKALPAPEDDAFGARAYETPKGEVEQRLAAIWTELLHIEKIGRRDHFFELGGHSLLAVTLIARMHKEGLHADVRTIFTTPVLADLAAAVSAGPRQAPIQVPPNLIPADCKHISPDMLPLVDLTQDDIECIVQSVPGGTANIADIYPLSPLQEGLLFHHLMTEAGDAYLMPSVLAFDTRKRLEDFIDALQKVIDRHDILRTAILWEELPEPVQVVWKRAPLFMKEMVLTGDHAGDALLALIDPRRHRIDVRKAPLMRAVMAEDKKEDRWLLGLLHHHLAIDHTSLELIVEEVRAHLALEQDRLPEPLSYRNFVAQARYGVSIEEHEAFFRQMLETVDEPTAPLGLMDVRQDGSGIAEASMALDSGLCLRLREHARQMGVSLASLCHLAWAKVMSLLSGRIDVVFGTVLFGRMQGAEGIDRVMGMFINTLPVRIVAGDESVVQAVHTTHNLLSRLLYHEHAPLSLAQRLSNVPPPAPLFTALLNYRYSRDGDGPRARATAWEGMELLYGDERSNYPISLDIDDFGKGLALTAQVQPPIEPMRICGYMATALEHLADALERSPRAAVRSIEVMGEAELRQVLYDWNTTEAAYPRDKCIHQLFEAQVEKTPEAVAVVHEDEQLTYARLNHCANQLARHLIAMGVRPDTRVAICVKRSLEMVVGLLAVLKAGGAYVPLDPDYPAQRLGFMLTDCAPVALLTQRSLKERRPELPASVALIELDTEPKAWGRRSGSNPGCGRLGLTADHPAYVIYTSGSTGKPKGVVVGHRSMVNQMVFMRDRFGLGPDDRYLQFASLSFDFSVEEIFAALVSGAALVLRTDVWLTGAGDFWALCQRHGVSVVDLPAQFWSQLIQDPAPVAESVRQIMTGGDMISEQALQAWFGRTGHRPPLINFYGPTETTINATLHEPRDAGDWRAIGRPVANTRIYILDPHGRPVPVGVIGELYIGGAGVARGYLNRPGLTAERFLPDPFAKATEHAPDPRMYRTGDLGRWLPPDGHIEFLGRNDFQVKIRGFRIEPGEIEARLSEIEGVKEAVVLARKDASGDKRLTAYYTGSDVPPADSLRAHLSSVLPGHMVPTAFVQLDTLPLTPNGKLDRKALPAPGGGAWPACAYKPPEGLLELDLTAIWTELLQMKWIGRHDNFFDLGGHSLMAMQMVSMMKQRGIDVQIAALFTHPTIERLAAYIEGEEKPVLPDGAVPIRREGNGPPLFLVHEFSGDVFYVMSLAQHIDTDIPVYGLAGTPLGEAPLRTMHAEAQRLVRIIRRVQPHGPYRIAGWSLGGNIAYEIATQLLGEDQDVAFVGLIDSLNFMAIPPRERHSLDDNSILLNHALEQVDDTDDALKDQLNTLSKTADLETFVQACQERQLLAPKMSLEDIRHHLARAKGYDLAMSDYHPPPIPVPIYLFKALEKEEYSPIHENDSDGHLGWTKALPKARIHAIPVPGTHLSMMSAPHIETLGRSLSEAVRQADAGKNAISMKGEAGHFTIQGGRAGVPPVFCVPGAGANITTFTSLATAMGEQWPIHGLQPRGLEDGHVPHATVPAAARAYLRVIDNMYPEGPLHLLGHSFGGWVVFDMALRLRAGGRAVDSVTMIDAEAPEGNGIHGPEYNRPQMFMQLVELTEQRAQCALNLAETDFDGLDYPAQLQLLHRRLVAAQIMPQRSGPESLRGMVRTFAANLRTSYVPPETYPEPVRLVLVRNDKDDEATRRRKHGEATAGWRCFAPELVTWRGPGNHMTILDPPHVATLADWLRASLCRHPF